MTIINKTTQSYPKYRPDIDGLRGIAVLLVVAFHTFPSLFNSGFIGVDVFFVISGFLISTIIFKSLDNNEFSFINFYSRRIKRIFPALLLVFITCYIFGWQVLLGNEFAQLGKHIAGGAAFVSNFSFWYERGYWDASANTKPLLHLWSLGIEEQFYIVWPLLLWYARKKRFNLLIVMSMLAILSFILNIRDIYVCRDPIASFYSPLTRCWELLMGAILAWFIVYRQEHSLLFVSKRSNHAIVQEICAFIGLLLLSVALLMTKEYKFPGYWALMPTLSAVLIIGAGPTTWINNKLLSNKLIVWFGVISFPLYLWHWPIISFMWVVVGSPSRVMRGLAIIMSIVFAWLTYKFIEHPIRLSKDKNKIKTMSLVLLMIIVGSIGYDTYNQRGFEFRTIIKGKTAFINHYQDMSDINIPDVKKIFTLCNTYYAYETHHSFATIDPSCIKEVKKNKQSIFVWGDSHSEVLSTGLNQYLKKSVTYYRVSSSGCEPSLMPKSAVSVYAEACNYANYLALKEIDELKPTIVILAQQHRHEFTNWERIASRLKLSGVKYVLLIGPVPQWRPSLLRSIIKRHWHDPALYIKDSSLDQSIINTDNLLKEKKFKELSYLSLINKLCIKNSSCLANLPNDEGLLVFDYGHLTPNGSRYVAKNFIIPLINNWLQD